MANCNVELKLNAQIVGELSRFLDDSYKKFRDEYFSKFDTAKNKLEDAQEDLQAITNKTGKASVEQAKTSISAAAFSAVLQILEWGGAVLLRALVANALINMRYDLQQRINSFEDLVVQINVLKTCFRIIAANIELVDKNDDLFLRVSRATNYVRIAFARSRQLIAIYENTNVFNDAVYRNMEKNLQLAQDNLISEEVQKYQADLKKYLEDNISGLAPGEGQSFLAPNLDAVLDAIASSTLNPNNISGRAAIALAPLYEFVTGGLDDKMARIVIAIEMAMQAIREMSVILPATSEVITNAIQAAGNQIANIFSLEGGGPSLFGEPESRDDTLLEQNGRILNKIAVIGSDRLDSSIAEFGSLISPLVSQINDVASEIGLVYQDMRYEIGTTRSNNELAVKANSWSQDIGAIQIKLGVITPGLGETIDDFTSFIRNWNDTIDYLKAYDVNNDLGSEVFLDCLAATATLPTGFLGQRAANRVVGRLIQIERKIRVAIDTDKYLLKLLDDLDLEAIIDPERLGVINDVIDFCDDTFPVLGELLRLADIDKISRAIKNAMNTASENIDEAMERASKALKWIKNGEAAEAINECADSLGVSLDIDFGFGNDDDEEKERDRKNIEQFYQQSSHNLRLPVNPSPGPVKNISTR